MTKIKVPMAKIEGPVAEGGMQAAGDDAGVHVAVQPQEHAPSQAEPQASSGNTEGSKAAAADAVRTAAPQAQAASGSQGKKAAPRTKAKVLVDEAATFDADEVWAQAGATEGYAGPTPDVPHGSFGWVSKAFPGREYTVLGGLCGLIGAILIFVVGFWPMLFVAILIAVGVALGQYLDGDPKIINQLRRLFSEGRGN